MPHVIVKMFPGRSEAQKKQLAERITKEVMAVFDCEEQWISVGMEEVQPPDWAEKVYRPEILDKAEKLYKKPGYNPFE
jgi:4-oxalocrotonate tautomerase